MPYANLGKEILEYVIQSDPDKAIYFQTFSLVERRYQSEFYV